MTCPLPQLSIPLSAPSSSSSSSPPLTVIPTCATPAVQPERGRTDSGTQPTGANRQDMEEEDEEVWRQYQRLTEVGVAPTTAPCPSPTGSTPQFPSLPPSRHARTAPRRSRDKRAAVASILRNLDPRMRFYVTAANASEYVTSGKMYTRSATPVWHRALLSHPGRRAASSNNNGGQAAPAERTPCSEVQAVRLSVEVVKLHTQQQATDESPNSLSPFDLNLIKDQVPGMDVTIIQQQLTATQETASASLTVVNQETDSRSRGRSARFGSATRRFGLAAEQLVEGPEEGEDTQPVHPFLRMYQTRPGAFARLLSRDADRKAARISPGSTIASLMVPHPVVAAGGGGATSGEGEEEEGEQFADCVTGTTIDMQRKKKRKKHRPRYTLPPLRFGPMDWPSRVQRRLGRRKKASKPNDEPAEETGDGSGSGSEAKKPVVPKAGLCVLSEFPKQFVLSAHEDDAVLDLGRSFSDTDADDWQQERSYDPAELRRLAQEMEAFADMDYSLPGHLEELLRQEGVDEQVVDSTVALEKLWHDRAVYLNRIYHLRRRKYLARPSRFSSLPPINRTPLLPKDSSPQPPLCSDVDARRERRENRSRPWEIPIDLTPEVPIAPRLTSRPPPVRPKPKEATIGTQAREELELFRTEVDRLRWEAERQEEVASLPADFIQPRLVLISSKVPRCHSMSKAIRRGDKSILYVVYDFDNCSFDELLETVRTRLEQYQPGCKAKSALFMCQGAEGCLYMFHKIVLTPQKMKRVQYQQIKEFWKSLGGLLSKVDDEDTAIHLLGGQLDTPQGKALLYEIQKAILPNLATVHWLQENSEGCREVIDHYFDFRKFLLWRSKHDSSNTLDYTDIVRSWSSLADEADDMDAAR